MGDVYKTIFLGMLEAKSPEEMAKHLTNNIKYIPDYCKCLEIQLKLLEVSRAISLIMYKKNEKTD